MRVRWMFHKSSSSFRIDFGIDIDSNVASSLVSEMPVSLHCPVPRLLSLFVTLLCDYSRGPHFHLQDCLQRKFSALKMSFA